MKIYIHRICFLILFFSFLLIAFSCEDFFSGNENKLPPDNQYKVTIQQGVWGNVWFWEGNFMPTTDNSSNGKITAVERNIYIYKATRVDSVIHDLNRYPFITPFTALDSLFKIFSSSLSDNGLKTINAFFQCAPSFKK